jgi:hypothetical protein
MFQSEVKTGELLKYMSRVVLVLDPRMGVNNGLGDGFVLALETGETSPGMFNVSVLEPLPPREENG